MTSSGLRGLAIDSLCAVMGGVLSLAISPATAQEVLPVLARVGPWPVVSRMVGFGERLWFANSVKGVNHNSADIYSYDPETGALRYERHLFSQDAGQPAAVGPLLYWPYEDSRFSLGWGQFQVTDGTRWASGTIPTARIYHVHAMTVLGSTLIAATSAWRAGFQASPDGGFRWQEAYDHPTPERRISRVTELVTLGGLVVGALRDPEGRRLVAFDGSKVVPLGGWPQNRPLHGLSAHGGFVYGLVENEDGVALWRSDGVHSEQVSVPRRDWRPRGLAAGAGGLWTVSAEQGGGLLWHRPQGGRWQVASRLEGGDPREVVVYAGRPYVAGAGDDGHGILWGPASPAPVALPVGPTAAMTALDLLSWRMPAERDWTAYGTRLDRLLAKPEAYESHGRMLRGLVYEAALAGPPPGFFADRLARGGLDQTLSLIGGAVEVPARKVARWILLWGMGLARQGSVPPGLIAEPWSAQPNRAEKYFETAPAAIWAVAEIGQADRATIAALVDRLDRAGDPRALTGDLVGALTALTGERLGYDIGAWRAWWAGAEPTWPDGAAGSAD